MVDCSASRSRPRRQGVWVGCWGQGVSGEEGGLEQEPAVPLEVSLGTRQVAIVTPLEA